MTVPKADPKADPKTDPLNVGDPARPAGLSPAMAAAREMARRILGDGRHSHDWDHTERVAALALRLAAAEGADADVVGVAAYFHDIGRAAQDASAGAVCHARKGEEMARELVEDLPLSPGQKDNVVHAVRAHRFRDDTAPATLEARVLFDADKLDSIGAVGVARAFQFAGEVGARLHVPGVDPAKTPAYSEFDTGYREYVVKLRHVATRMQTPTGRDLARKRHAFMTAFFKRFLSECQGER